MTEIIDQDTAHRDTYLEETLPGQLQQLPQQLAPYKIMTYLLQQKKRKTH